MSKIVQFPNRRPPRDQAEYVPDPRNGEVYATESVWWQYLDGQEIQTPDGFIVVHMSRSCDSASIDRGFATLAEAEAAAVRIARERNAVLA